MEVWIPPKALPKYRCTVPIGDGELCNKPFYEGEERARERHAAKCAAEHAAEIHESSIRTKLPGFYGPEAGIPDLEQWVDKNRTELIEGRKKI